MHSCDISDSPRYYRQLTLFLLPPFPSSACINSFLGWFQEVRNSDTKTSVSWSCCCRWFFVGRQLSSNDENTRKTQLGKAPANWIAGWNVFFQGGSLETCLYFHPYLGKMNPIWLIFFHMGWKHQPVLFDSLLDFLFPNCLKVISRCTAPKTRGAWYLKFLVVFLQGGPLPVMGPLFLSSPEQWKDKEFVWLGLVGKLMQTLFILLMEEILYHIGCIKPCKWWDKLGHKLPINWCRSSAINSRILLEKHQLALTSIFVGLDSPSQ